MNRKLWSNTISGLPAGIYRVRAEAEGYVREYYQETYRYDEATLVSVTASVNTSDIDFTLDLGGTISGHVYQSDGATPIVDAVVVAFKIVPGYTAIWAEISGNIEQFEQRGSWLPSQIPIPLPEKSAGWSYLDVEIGELDPEFNQALTMLPPS